jgi:hypothetical protein
MGIENAGVGEATGKGDRCAFVAGLIGPGVDDGGEVGDDLL